MPTAIAIVVIILMVLLAYSLWRFMLGRAMRAVVSVFRQHKATDAQRAVTLEALGLVKRKGFLANMFSRVTIATQQCGYSPKRASSGWPRARSSISPKTHLSTRE